MAGSDPSATGTLVLLPEYVLHGDQRAALRGEGWGRHVATAAANDVNSSFNSNNNGCFLYINSSSANSDSVGEVLVEFSLQVGTR